METTEKAELKCCNNRGASAGVSGGVYGLAFIGALVYFLQHSTTFWAGVLGVLKALVWPAILVYHALGFLNL